MYRDYTQVAFDELKQQIANINDSDFCGFTDLLGDCWTYCRSWIGALSIDNYVNDVSSYHRVVLDQHDTTLEKLENIFWDVSSEDRSYKYKFEEVKDTLETYNEALALLKDTIRPNAFTSTGIARKFSSLISPLCEANEGLDEIYGSTLAELEKGIVKDAGKQLVTDVLGLASNLAGYVGNVATGQFAAAAANVWGVLNGFFTTGEDVGAVLTIGISAGLSALLKDDDIRLKGVEMARESMESEGIAGELERAGMDEDNWLYNGVKAVDTAAAVVGIVSAAKGVVKYFGSISNTVDVLTNDMISPGMKVEHVCGEILEALGKKTVTTSDGKIISNWKEAKDVISNISNGVTWINALADGKPQDQILKNNPITKFAKDVQDLVEDSCEWISNMAFA